VGGKVLIAGARVGFWLAPVVAVAALAARASCAGSSGRSSRWIGRFSERDALDEEGEPR